MLATPTTRTARRALAGLLVTIALAAACSEAGGEPPCERPCPFGFECAFVDSGPRTTCLEAAPTGCDPACSALEQCTVSVCTPVDRTLSCDAALTCLAACPAPGDCTARCEARTKFGDLALLETLNACLQANGCADSACAEASCGDALTACLETSQDCGDVDRVGQCDGQVLSFCEDDKLRTGDCRAFGPGCTCGRDPFSQLFDCSCPSEVCEPACPNGAVCVEGMCQLGGGGGCNGLQPGQSVCQGTVLTTCTGTRLQSQDCADFSCSCGPSANTPNELVCCP